MGRQIITAVILLAALGGGVYFWWNRSSDPSQAVSTPYIEEMEGKLAEYRKIQSLSPNLSIFDDKLFQALRPSGSGAVLTASTTVRVRPNPFAPF